MKAIFSFGAGLLFLASVCSAQIISSPPGTPQAAGTPQTGAAGALPGTTTGTAGQAAPTGATIPPIAASEPGTNTETAVPNSVYVPPPAQPLTPQCPAPASGPSAPSAAPGTASATACPGLTGPSSSVPNPVTGQTGSVINPSPGTTTQPGGAATGMPMPSTPGVFPQTTTNGVTTTAPYGTTTGNNPYPGPPNPAYGTFPGGNPSTAPPATGSIPGANPTGTPMPGTPVNPGPGTGAGPP